MKGMLEIQQLSFWFHWE